MRCAHMWLQVRRKGQGHSDAGGGLVLFSPRCVAPPTVILLRSVLLSPSSALGEPLGPAPPGPCPPTSWMLLVRGGDGFPLAFLSAERALPGLARGHFLSVGVVSGVTLGLGSLGSGAASSAGWREERPLPPSRSCALERRGAAMRAMLLVPTAISLRAWALSPASAAVLGVGVPGSQPAGEHSLETSVFMLWELGFCGERCSGGPSAAPGWAQQQTQRQGSRVVTWLLWASFPVYKVRMTPTPAVHSWGSACSGLVNGDPKSMSTLDARVRPLD